MKNFEFAQPTSEREAIAFLSDRSKRSVLLAGGTELIELMNRGVMVADRVIHLGQIASLKEIECDTDGNTWIGATVCLDAFLENAVAEQLPSLVQVIHGISSVQLQSQGTMVGELLRRPGCWYFRNGYGLLANEGKQVIEGDSRYHAILGNHGPAKFVSASRLAPALIALGARLRVIGPESDAERIVDLERFFQTPRCDDELETCLLPGQLVTHLIIPPSGHTRNAAYEVRHGEGPDQPLAAAAVAIELRGGQVQAARIVLGQVAPTPWIAREAARFLIGKRIDEPTAAIAGFEAVIGARPLADNEYKVQLAQICVKRAILRAIGLETGGLDAPFTTAEPSEAAGEIART